MGRSKKKRKHKERTLTETKPQQQKRSGLRINKSVFTTIVVILIGATVLIYDYIQRSKRPAIPEVVWARAKGHAQAALKITEYIDFQCPECAKGTKILTDYLTRYPDEIFLEVKYFPHQKLTSMESAVYAQCAARQERFWEFHDRLLAEQAAWRSLLEPSLIFRKMARELKLDMKALEDCVNSAQVRNAILLEKAEGESRFVKSTPTYFLNGEMIVGTKSLQERLRSYFP